MASRRSRSRANERPGHDTVEGGGNGSSDALKVQRLVEMSSVPPSSSRCLAQYREDVTSHTSQLVKRMGERAAEPARSQAALGQWTSDFRTRSTMSRTGPDGTLSIQAGVCLRLNEGDGSADMGRSWKSKLVNDQIRSMSNMAPRNGIRCLRQRTGPSITMRLQDLEDDRYGENEMNMDLDGKPML